MSIKKITLDLKNNDDVEPEVDEEEEEEEEEEVKIDSDDDSDKESTDDSSDDSSEKTDATEDDEDNHSLASSSEDETDDVDAENDDVKNETKPGPTEVFKIEKKSKKPPTNKKSKKHIEDDIDEIIDDINDEIEDEDDEPDYLQKFDESIRKNIIEQYHPEMVIKNNAEIETLSRVVRNSNGNIIDPFHKTLPFLTKYEKARILGERANQINEGSPIFVNIDNDVIDGYLIALKEFEERKIPFIIQRPLPNGTCEYWRLQDLEII